MGGPEENPVFNHGHRTPFGPKARRKLFRPAIPLIATLFIILAIQFVVLPGYVYQLSPSEVTLSKYHLNQLDARLQKCAEQQTPPVQYPVTKAGSRTNPRWNGISGQQKTVLLRNVTLFDGDKIVSGFTDVVFKNGVITAIGDEGSFGSLSGEVDVWDLNGRYVTPGLIDMHSHHLSMSWPLLDSTDDTNEIHPDTGPLTPQVRIIDSLKAYDIATTIIASGGVTTSLILPGSANIMGGEAVLVKNALRSGENGEEVVEEILFEHGIAKHQRRRFMKMACGENPRRVYDHTRMGNAWAFRKHMERAKELKGKQDAFCLEAAAIKERGDAAAIKSFVSATLKDESATDYLEYDSSIAMLRGQVGINIHCYETEDFEDMIKHSKEFGFRIQAFHHALDAWEVPELIKASGENITIATFSEFGFYKKEAYEANLYAGKILAEHGVPVAYKSDHVQAETNAKYLLFQAATAHSFGLSEELALQSVTSVPARSLELDHRVGFVKPGFDADLVVWDSHPLSVGATALQVYIDGKPTLEREKVSQVIPESIDIDTLLAKPIVRTKPEQEVKETLCKEVEKPGSKISISGITQSFLRDYDLASSAKKLTMVIDNGKIICFDSSELCTTSSSNSIPITLKNGHVLPGLTAVSVSLGLLEISGEDSSSDGVSTSSLDAKDVSYAKYGIHLEGRGFSRARIAGVTRAITPPLTAGLVEGVSVGFKTSGKKTILNGGIFEEDVALHFTVGQEMRGKGGLSSVSAGISKLRQIVFENKDKDNVFGSAANGSIPLVVHVENEYDITQVIKIKQDYPASNVVILGGSGAPLVADELAAAKIPVILTANRGAPDTFEKRNSLPGPPLSRSPAAVLSDAGVKYGLAISGESDCHIHNLPIEAGWAAKFAGISKKEAVDLVSRNIEEILGLAKAEDFVVYEGDPLEFGASVVLAIDGDDGGVSMCWPEST